MTSFLTSFSLLVRSISTSTLPKFWNSVSNFHLRDVIQFITPLCLLEPRKEAFNIPLSEMRFFHAKIMTIVYVTVKNYRNIFPGLNFQHKLTVYFKALYETITTLHYSINYRLQNMLAQIRDSFESVELCILM